MNYTQCGSALALPYAAGIAQTCVTSPPYYGLRDYGTARWEGGDPLCSHALRPDGGPKQLTNAGGAGHVHRDCRCGAKRIDSQIGLEQTPAAYVAQIVAAMREVWRVLRPDGTLWLNLGDSYASMNGRSSTGKAYANGPNSQLKHMSDGQNVGIVRGFGDAKPKDLMGIPWRVAFALQDDGWYLRSDIIWAKPNPMPESVTDRPTKAHEYVFLLAKQPRYYYDAEAIKESAQPFRAGGANNALDNPKTPKTNKKQDELGKNTYTGFNDRWAESGGVENRNARSVWQIATQPYSGAHFATMPPELARRCILAGSRPGDIVLDPFAGSGTTAMVALQNGRRAIGTELNPKYLRLQDDRTQVTIGLGLVLA